MLTEPTPETENETDTVPLSEVVAVIEEDSVVVMDDGLADKDKDGATTKLTVNEEVSE